MYFLNELLMSLRRNIEQLHSDNSLARDEIQSMSVKEEEYED